MLDSIFHMGTQSIFCYEMEWLEIVINMITYSYCSDSKNGILIK